MINILSTVSEVNVSVLQVIFGIISAYIVLFLALLAFMVICWWKIFKKAGKEGWEAIVPIYSNIVALQITNNPIWLIVVFLVPGLNAIGLPLYTILVAINLCKAFNKEGAFALLLIFVPIVGYPILAFGKDKYHLPEPLIK